MNYVEIQPGEVLHLRGTENSGFSTQRTSRYTSLSQLQQTTTVCAVEIFNNETFFDPFDF